MSGSVNTAIPLSGKMPEPVNPLTQLGQFTQLGNQINQLRTGEQTLAARQAMGPLMQQSIDPTTGAVDPRKFNRLLAQSPAAAFLTPEAVAQSQQMERSQQQLQLEQLSATSQRMDHLGRTLTGLLANPNVTQQDVIKSVTALLALPEGQRPFEATTAASVLGTMPQDPRALQQWLQTRMVQTQQAQTQLAALLPQAGQVGLGGSVVQTNRDPLTGQVTQAGGGAANMPTTMSPDGLNAPVQTFDPATGRPIITPRVGALPVVNGAGQPQGAAPGPLGNGRYPGQQAAAGVSPPPSSAPAGPALGEASAAEVTAARSAEGGATLAARAAQIPERRAILENLDSLIGQFSSGQGADWQRIAQSFANRTMPSSMQMNPAGLASQEEFNKQAMELASAQFQALGGSGSNMQLDQTRSTSPSELLSNLGNKGIIAMLRGNEDALDVKHRAWQEYSATHGSGSYGRFTAEWNRDFNPRIFAAGYLDDASRTKMFKGMTERQQNQYLEQYASAIQRGWVRPPERVSRAAAPAAAAPVAPARPPEDPRTLGYVGP